MVISTMPRIGTDKRQAGAAANFHFFHLYLEIGPLAVRYSGFSFGDDSIHRCADRKYYGVINNQRFSNFE